MYPDNIVPRGFSLSPCRFGKKAFELLVATAKDTVKAFREDGVEKPESYTLYDGPFLKRNLKNFVGEDAARFISRSAEKLRDRLEACGIIITVNKDWKRKEILLLLEKFVDEAEEGIPPGQMVLRDRKHDRTTTGEEEWAYPKEYSDDAVEREVHGSATTATGMRPSFLQGANKVHQQREVGQGPICSLVLLPRSH